MLRGELLTHELLQSYNTWRVGGRAKQLYKPADLQDLQEFLRQLPSDEKIFWLGLGSNLLIRDGGYDGTVIVTQGKLKDITLLDDGCSVRAGAGVACAQLARFCARHDLSGVEFLAGIPGTVGGALKMNAGCHDGETWQWVKGVRTVDRQGHLHDRSIDEFQVQYRYVTGPEDEWFISGDFALQAGNKAESLAKIKTLLDRRKATQPINAMNCGSVFRNPDNDYAARLIEACGLKGYCIGDAQVSEKHANFIINRGDAKADDIERLIAHVEQTVAEQQQIQLQREVHIVGRTA